MSNLNKDNFSAEEEGLFKDLAFRAAMNNGGNIPKDVANNITTLKSVIKNIPTTAGRKYALSKLLNDSKFGFDKDLYQNDSKFSDAWSVKHQDDYKAPDVVKAEEKRDKEDFFDWDSANHWSKKSTKDLERRARDAGYADRGSYLKAVGDAQVQKDREKLIDDLHGYITRVAYPRATEAVMRGDDIQAKDIGLDLAEQALYTLNPGGRIAQAAKLGEKAGKLGKIGEVAADIASNPAILEGLDALAYDDPNNARSEANPADIAIGAGINAGMNKVVNTIFKDVVKDNAKYINSIQYDKDREAITALKSLGEEAESRGNKELADVVNRKMLDKLTDMVERGKIPENIKDRFTNKWNRQIAKQDVINDAASLISNKTGDLISENPKLTRSLVSRAFRVPGLRVAGPLVDAYYESKEAESEKDKLNKMLDKLK